MGRDHNNLLLQGFRIRFQSTRPCGTRQSYDVAVQDGMIEFQSTRPCGTRLENDYKNKKIISCISIHAPLWDATNKSANTGTITNISIHAPLWDATFRRECLTIRLLIYFNPRAPVGRDRNILYHLLQLYIFNNNFDSINSEKKLFFYYFLLESYIKKCVTQVL